MTDHRCNVAPAGSVLVHTGSGSGGRGSKWYFRRGSEESVGFSTRQDAEDWARLGWIKFQKAHPNSGVRKPKKERKK